MLRYTTDRARPGLVALYDIQPGNEAGLFLQPWNPHGANEFFKPNHTHAHCVLTAIFPGEPGLAGGPLNSPSPFIPGLRILLGQT